MAKTGRPAREITDEMIQALAAARRACQPLHKLAGIAAVHPQTLTGWIGLGNDEDARLLQTDEHGNHPAPDPARAQYLRLSRALRTASHDGILHRLQKIEELGDGGQLIERTVRSRRLKDGTVEEVVTEKYARGQWLAHAWSLERTEFQDFARRTINELTGIGGGPIQTSGEVTLVDQQSLIDRGRAVVMELLPGGANDQSEQVATG